MANGLSGEGPSSEPARRPLLPDRGRLAVLPVPRLLLLLREAGYSGVLVLQGGDETLRATWRAGRVVRVAGPDGLCARLSAAGELPPDAARRVAALRQRGLDEARALAAARVVSPGTLLAFLRQHERDLLHRSFVWADGSFALEPGGAPEEAATAGTSDVLPLVQAGVAAHWDRERMVRSLGRLGGRWPVAPSSSEDATAAAACGALPALGATLGRVDPARPLAAQIREAPDANESARLWLLAALEVLELRDAAPGDAEPETGAAPGAAPEIEVVVAGRGPAPEREEHRSTAGGGPPDPAQGLRRELTDLHARMDRLDPYALLGVARGADTGAIRRAYVQAAKRWHPDALARLGLGDLREQANALFARIGRAHAILCDPAQRRALDAGGDPGPSSDADRAAAASGYYQKGEVLLRQGRFAEALQMLRPAVELAGGVARHRCALGWALYKQPQADPDAACAELSRAVELDPGLALAHHRLGLVLRALGKGEQAGRHLAEAQALQRAARGGAANEDGAPR